MIIDEHDSLDQEQEQKMLYIQILHVLFKKTEVHNYSLSHLGV